MRKILKRAAIVLWESDGEYIDLRYKQDDGQEVVAIFQRIGWARPPADVMEEVTSALKAGPQTIVGRQGPRPS
jgi:hypothetical protein